MPPQLTVHNAEIKTATVEIKTLTLSGKQVTLAVFRQLPIVPLNGTPWGWVNYCPEWRGCAAQRSFYRGGAHRHVVWQDGDTLARDSVWERQVDPAVWSAVLALPQLFIAV